MRLPLERRGRSQDPEDPEPRLRYQKSVIASFFISSRQCNKAAAAPAHGLKAMNIDEQAMAEARQAMMEEDSDEASEKDEDEEGEEEEASGEESEDENQNEENYEVPAPPAQVMAQIGMRKPKRPKNAYLHFVCDMTSEFSESNHSLGRTEMMQAIGRKWKALDESGRRPYNLMAAEAKQNYMEEMRAWKEAQSWSSRNSEHGEDAGRKADEGNNGGSDGAEANTTEEEDPEAQLLRLRSRRSDRSIRLKWT